MDSAYEVDIDGLLRTVRSTDHLIVRFSTLAERLFLDFRTRGLVGPGVFVLPPAESIQDRMASIAEPAIGSSISIWEGIIYLIT